MKKTKRIIALILIFLLAAATGFTGSATQSTTYTYTISVDGDWIRTQEGYVASGIYMKEAGLLQPGDFFIEGDNFYIADTGNRRIVVYNKKDNEIRDFGNDVLLKPSGVFIKDDKVYVADPEKEAVIVFDKSGNVLLEIGRPQNTPLMSSISIFKPHKVAVSSEGSMFVVGEGAYEGLMHFDDKGVFHGYFAANKRNLTILESIQELFFTRQQKEQLFTRKPRAIQNIDISSRDLLYSVTQSSEVNYAWSSAEVKTDNALKLHNMAGTNILSPNTFMDDEWNFVDVASGPYGNSYALTYTGLIYEYDSFGNLIFSFGGRAVSNDRYGLFTYATAIDLDDDGFIYVLDKERGMIQYFSPTEFSVSTHKAISDLESGNYDDSEETWSRVLKLNGMSRIAHVGYGKSLFRQQRYEEALNHFEIAGDRENYSQCIWEIRNNWINKNIIWIIVLMAVLLVLFVIRGFTKNKKVKYSGYSISDRPKEPIANLLVDLKFGKTMLQHPIDSLYYFKKGKRGSFLASGILFVLGFLAYILDFLLRGFIFQRTALNGLSPIMVTLLFFIPVFLFIIGNYMMATINEGEGSLKSIVVFTSYSLIPYILAMPLVVGLSYIFTLNEGFVIQIIWLLAVVWTAVLLFLGVMHIHNFSFKETVKNMLLTLVFMILAVVTAAILYMIWDKFVGFILEIFAEVRYRVEN